MFLSIRRWALGALALSFLSLAPLAAQAQPADADAPTVIHSDGRPAPLAETIPPVPQAGLVWVPGHWTRKAFSDLWTWQTGYYEDASGVAWVGPGPRVIVAPGPFVVTHPVYVHRYWYPWRARVGWRWHRW